jgi:uncharacterized membrane protein YccC
MTTTATVHAPAARASRRLGLWFHAPPDPNHAALRVAARTTVVLFILSVLFDGLFLSSTLGIVAIYAGLGLLAAANFGGPTRMRVRSYGFATVVGTVLTAAMTLCLGNLAVAVAVASLLVIVVCVLGSLGGQVGVARVAMIQAVAVAAILPVHPSDWLVAAAGYAIAGVLSMLAAVFLWPFHEEERLRTRVATTLRLFVRRARGERVPIVASVAELLVDYTTLPQGAAGFGDKSVATGAVIDQIVRLAQLIGDAPGPSTSGSGTPERAHLLESLADACSACAESLERRTPIREPAAIERALADAEAAYRSTVEARYGSDTAASLTDAYPAFDEARRLLVVASIARSIVVDVAISSGDSKARPTYDGRRAPAALPLSPLARIPGIIAGKVRPGSVVLRTALQAAVAIGLAVLVIRSLDVPEGVWAITALLAALRSSARNTTHRAVSAMVGTTVGFAVGALVFALVDPSKPMLWVALPITVFLAVYTPRVTNFAVAQFCFALWSITILNIVKPVGSVAGTLRFADVLIGCLVAVLGAGLLWPRGSRNVVRATTASLYRRSTHALRVALATGDIATPERAARLELIRSAEALGQLITEGHTDAAEVAAWTTIVSGGAHVTSASRHVPVDPLPAADPAVAAVQRDLEVTLASFDAVADRLDGSEAYTVTVPPGPATPRRFPPELDAAFVELRHTDPDLLTDLLERYEISALLRAGRGILTPALDLLTPKT